MSHKPKSLAPLLLLAPFIVLMAIFIWGLADGVMQSLGHIPAFGLDGFTMEYIKSALANGSFWQSLGISLYIATISAIVAIILAVLLSFALSTLKKTHGVLCAIIKIPMFIPWMITGLLMIDLFGKSGWLARVFHALGMNGAAESISGILHHPNQLGTIIAFAWACTPFACFLILTVMSNISGTYGEAAQTLGAGLWKRFINVTLPLCRPIIQSTFLIIQLSCFGSYEIPTLLGMTTPRALPVEIYYQYHHYDLRHRPNAMSLNTLALLCSLILAATVHAIFALISRRKKS